MRQFRANMRDHVATVQSELAVAPADLSPPDFLEEALQTLKVLAKSYDTSVAAADESNSEFEAVLAEALDPFLGGCVNLQKGMEQPNGAIFAINCLFAVTDALSGFKFVAERVREMEDTIDEHVAALVEYQHQYLLHESGLIALQQALEDVGDTHESLKGIPQLDAFKPEALVATSQQLDEFLPSALIDAAENLKQLRNRSKVQEITEEAAAKFCEDFESVEREIVAADDLLYDEDREEQVDEPGLRDLFPRTGGEIRVLLS
jgi:hypothetical protein